MRSLTNHRGQMEDIDKQVHLFIQAYDDGEAIVQRYLKVVNSTDYLTRKESFHQRGGSRKSKNTHDGNDGRTQRLDRRSNA